MAKIKFLTDSASDITDELEKKLDIQIMNFKVARVMTATHQG